MELCTKAPARRRTASRSESHRQGGLDTVRQWAWEGPWAAVLVRLDVRSLQP